MEEYYMVSAKGIYCDFISIVKAKNKQKAVDIVYKLEYKEDNKRPNVTPTYKKDLTAELLDDYLLGELKQSYIEKCLN